MRWHEEHGFQPIEWQEYLHVWDLLERVGQYAIASQSCAELLIVSIVSGQEQFDAAVTTRAQWIEATLNLRKILAPIGEAILLQPQLSDFLILNYSLCRSPSTPYSPIEREAVPAEAFGAAYLHKDLSEYPDAGPIQRWLLHFKHFVNEGKFDDVHYLHELPELLAEKELARAFASFDGFA